MPTLAAILAEPAVARWFGGGDPTEIARDWVEAGDTVVFAIEVDGEAIGSVQYYEETDPGYRHAGMDVFVATRGMEWDSGRSRSRCSRTTSSTSDGTTGS